MSTEDFAKIYTKNPPQKYIYPSLVPYLHISLQYLGVLQDLQHPYDCIKIHYIRIFLKNTATASTIATKP